MEKITECSDDMLIVRGINVFPMQIEELVLERDELSGHCRIELTRAGRLDDMLIRVEAQPEGFGVTNAGPVLVLAVKERVGVSARVEVLPPGRIERSLSKARRVIDWRPKI